MQTCLCWLAGWLTVSLSSFVVFCSFLNGDRGGSGNGRCLCLAFVVGMTDFVFGSATVD